MSARGAILAAIHRAAVPAAELPEMPAPRPGAEPADLVRRFVAALRGVGGSAVQLAGREMLATAVAAHAAGLGEPAGTGVVSCVPGLPISTVNIGSDASRERLNAIALAVVPARFGVAENGAVWVDERDLPHRAVPFIAEHVAVVLAKSDIVADLHDAYRRLRPPLPGYGVFVSGPSKTADIEQALVIGAQGPKSLVVLLV